MKCKDCSNYKDKRIAYRWEKVWETCPDFKEGNGTLPFWLCLFIPIIAPLVYLLYYRIERLKVKLPNSGE